MPYEGDGTKGMMLYALRYAEELRDAGEIFSDLKNGKIEPDQLDLAKELIKRSTAKFNPEEYKDDYEAALRELIDAKMNHRELPPEAPPKKGKVISLTEALRQSLAEKKPSASEKKPPKSTTAGRSSAKKVAAARGSRR